jgi:hypothetical protein
MTVLKVHHPNQLQSFDQNHMTGWRKKTFPAGCQPVDTLPRPCIPARTMLSGFDTAIRA